MDSLITIVCYKDGKIIDGPNGVCYNCPPKKGVLINNLIKYDELEDKLCLFMLIDRIHTMLSIIFWYPILMLIGNGNITCIQTTMLTSHLQMKLMMWNFMMRIRLIRRFMMINLQQIRLL